MTLTVPTIMPPQLVSRAQVGDTPVQCDCGVSYLWHANQPMPACPGCGTTLTAPAVAPALRTAALQGQAQLDRAVAKATDAQRSASMPITSASLLAQALRDQIADARRQVDDAHSAVGAAIGDILDSTSAAKGVAAQLKQEAAELRAAVGLNTNSPPGGV